MQVQPGLKRVPSRLWLALFENYLDDSCMDWRYRRLTERGAPYGAFMASGYAKLTGKLGVCVGTTGPGAVHLLNGLYDANMDGSPVVAITGMTFHDLIGTRYQQGVDTTKLMQDVALYNV